VHRNETLCRSLANPETGVGSDLNIAFLKKDHSFPNADGRQPKLIFRVFEGCGSGCRAVYSSTKHIPIGCSGRREFYIAHDFRRTFHAPHHQPLILRRDGRQLCDGFARLGDVNWLIFSHLLYSHTTMVIPI
jgi:hypothetical protein